MVRKVGIWQLVPFMEATLLVAGLADLSDKTYSRTTHMQII